MMGKQKFPCACEADVYGAASQFLLQTVAVQPMFLVDLVDLDPEDDTGVVSHCGQAPVSMADPDAAVEAVIHGNRRMPLLYRFALKPGTVTSARLSQAHGEPKLVVAGAEVLRRPMAFTGASGVVRFRRPAGEIVEQVMNSDLEHHMALAYGDHTEALVYTAAALGLPVLEL
jgi:L-fucose isomerase-like protein